jgi:DNA-binding HxlR family transcriptional regulator
MDTEKFASGICGIGRALTRAGDAWSMLILRDAGLGHARFDEFQKSLGIAPNILARRLAALVDDGMLEKRLYSEHPPRHEYVLTDAGRDYLPILYAIGAWGHAHCGGGAPLSRLIDRETGRGVMPLIVDRRTGQPLREMDLRVVAPASPKEESDIAAMTG